MKTKLHFIRITLALLVSILNPQRSTVFAQGSLTPPGAPAPTMKSLAQIEPRIAITNSGAVTISQPGSYYLTTNIAVSSGNAITIAASGVALDLNGFTLSSTEASPAGTGILLADGLRNIRISNGFIQGGVTNNGGFYGGPGFGNGIAYTNLPPFNVQVSGVSVSGCLYYGIYLGFDNSTAAESCAVWTVGDNGITASSVSHCTAYQCGRNAIAGTTISDAYGYSVGGFFGISGLTIHNSYGYSSGSGFGAVGLYARVADNCHGVSSESYGILANSASHCYGESQFSSAISAKAADNCSAFSNGSGIVADTLHNCYAVSTSSGTTALAGRVAQNCYAFNSAGGAIWVDIAENCEGESQGSGIGIDATYSAINCYGRSVSGIGLRCLSGVAFGCYGSSGSSIGLNAYISHSSVGAGPAPYSLSYKYNQPFP